MESCQQQENSNFDSDENQEINPTNEQWSNRSFAHNVETKEDVQTEILEDLSYECDEVYVNVESQDIFTVSNSSRNSLGQIGNNYDMTDSDVGGGLSEMGKYCIDLDADISTKQNEIQLLLGHVKAMESEIEEKQKALETLKVELLTEQDNYDDTLKKLNDEIELITTTNLQQEALNKQSKNFFTQKHTVDQLLEEFETEFYANKVNAEKVLNMFQEKINDLESTLQEVLLIKKEIDIKKTHFFTKKLSAEENLKSKTSEMERMQDNLKVKYYQQIAILEFLKIKGDEEWAKYSEFQSELKSIDETEQQQIHLEEDECVKLEEKIKLTNNKLLELQQTISKDKTVLNQTVREKNNLHEQIEKLLQKEATQVQESLHFSKVLSEINTDTKLHKTTLNAKAMALEENMNLKNCIKDLETKEKNILENENYSDNSKMEVSKKCMDLETNLNASTEEQLLMNELKNNLNLTKTNLLQNLKETTDENTRFINDLKVQKESFKCEKYTLECRISETNRLVKSHLTTVDNQSDENLKIEQHLQDNSEKITILNNRITELNNEISRINNQFDVDMLAVKNEICEKEKIKGDLEIQINKNVNLQMDIDFLKGEHQVINCQLRDELETMKENCAAELQVKQDGIENKKNEFEFTYKEIKAKVSELQEEFIDEQKNELQMVKSVQKLTYIVDDNNREIDRLKNVIKTLDLKLTTIAQTVSKEQSQSTTTSSAMRPPATQKPAIKHPNSDGTDSSSSGISMHGNNTNWKKQLLKKQQLLNTQTATSVSSNSSQQLPTARSTRMQKENIIKTKRLCTYKPNEKMAPKNSSMEQSATAKKQKK